MKILFFGGGTFIAGKILGPFFSRSLNNPIARDEAFRITDDKKTFSVFDESGEEVLLIDKEE